MNQTDQYSLFRLINNLPIDFNKLVILEPRLRPYVLILNHRTVCNFIEQRSLIALTKAIMRHCLRLQWDCPLTNLCPRIPSRFNYLLWIYLYIESPIHVALDIGTGATLIYPLLGFRLFGWKFIATDIDSQSFAYSATLISTNKMQRQIDLRLTPTRNHTDQIEQTALLGVIRREEAIDVVICNPPFFESQENTKSQMILGEHHVEDGEYGFFFKLYKESFCFPHIRFFTCLVGRPSSFHEIQQFLISEHRLRFIQWVKFGQIDQGNSRRYIVAWQINWSEKLKALLEQQK